ncbi:cellulose binding domain-containing protein [Streptomyces sp. CAU 1734]|uniref:cellulose binding domain-containing protein n=1 Tax=Streptomyces sp. CAU 1734 TaxID=3140360 RepID=UPI003260BC9E
MYPRTARLRRTAALTASAGLIATTLAALPAPAAAAPAPVPPAAAAPVPASAAARDGVRLQYRTSAPAATASQAAPWFRLANTGSTALPLSQVTIRYHFRADTPTARYRFACDWAELGCAGVTGTVHTPAEESPGADRYLEIGFTGGTLAPGAGSGDLRLRLHRTDWRNVDQSDDHSFGPGRTAWADWSRATVHRDGTQIWGTAPNGTVPSPANTFFDDFAYTGPGDWRLGAHGWYTRSWGGGPGLAGAGWSPSAVSFPTVDGEQVLRLDSHTDGTLAGTVQGEISQQRKFHTGTYAARVWFSDAPLEAGAGAADGDQSVQTFFTITPLRHDMDPEYGELDFEYLPNGGWGHPGHVMFATSWETYGTSPWNPVNTHTTRDRSHAGWHDLVLQVSGGTMRYYIDGELLAEHGGIHYPETPMLLSFNNWFNAILPPDGTRRTYREQADWVYFAKDTVLTPAQVKAEVAGHRARGTAFTDTVPAP